MDEDYRKPVRVNRYWKRPKPKVYDCNMRDAERMYKENYKEYLMEKDFRLKKDREWSTDGDRFAHLRAGPIHRRATSAQPSTHETSSTVESILQRVAQHREEAAKEAEEAEPTVTVNVEHKPIPAYDPQKENQSLEERLARLKRLREDLGLPHDTETSKTTLRDSRDSASRTFASENDSSYKSERSTRMSSRAGAAATSDDSSYSFRSERASKVNGTDDFKTTPTSERKTERKREEFNITPKMERKSFASKAGSSDDYSYKSEKKTDRFSKLSTSASSSSPVRTRKAIAATENLELDDEDDALMAKMMKKMPSSQEILERISKMDLDD